MDESELSELKRKKLAEYQALQAAEQQKKSIVRSLVEPKAYERLMLVKMSNTDIYDQVVSALATAYRQGRIRGKVTEAEIVEILGKFMGTRREPTITIKRKGEAESQNNEE